MNFAIDCLTTFGKCVLGGALAMVGIVFMGILSDSFRRYFR